MQPTFSADFEILARKRGETVFGDNYSRETSDNTAQWRPSWSDIFFGIFLINVNKQINKTELYIHFFDWLITKQNSIWFQINREMVNTIWFRCDLTSFRNYFSVRRVKLTKMIAFHFLLNSEGMENLFKQLVLNRKNISFHFLTSWWVENLFEQNNLI